MLITTLIIIAAKYVIAVPVAVFIYCAYSTHNKKTFLQFAVLCGALAFGLSLIASALYYNPRPFMVTGVPPLVEHGPGNGFPSDHSLLAGTIAAIVTAFNPYLGATLWLVALVVGIGRVFAGVHHYIDIFASFAIAIASGIIIQYFLRTKRGRGSSQS